MGLERITEKNIVEVHLTKHHLNVCLHIFRQSARRHTNIFSLFFSHPCQSVFLGAETNIIIITSLMAGKCTLAMTY